MPLPLEGVRIVDLSMFMSGPLVTLIAADLGADVIKVESVQRLDGWRGGGSGGQSAVPAWEGAPSYNWINRNKRGITLNLSDPAGADLLKRIVTVSDVVVENYTPRVMENFGLDYEALRSVKPELIMLSMPGFGATGPWRDYTAFAWSTEQMAGISHLTGYQDGPPLFTNTTGGDPLAGLMGTVALFSAIHHRKRTGKGQHIDLSQLEASTWFVGDAVVEAALTGKSPIRAGNRSTSMAPHNFYRSGDGKWVAIACRDDEEWRRLALLIGRPEWAAADSRLATGESRQQELALIDQAVTEWTETLPADSVARLCQAERIPAGVVLDGPGLLLDPHLSERGFFISLDRQWIGEKRYPGQPFRLSRTEPVQNRPAPLLGEHTAEVLSSLLGLGADDLQELEERAITGTVPLAAR